MALLSPLWILKAGNVDNRSGCVVEIEESRIACDPYDLEVLKFGHEAEANALAKTIARGKQAPCKSAADDGDMRMVLSIAPTKVTPAKQADAERAKETGRDDRRGRRHASAWAGGI